MSTLRSQAHWLVAQKPTHVQNQPKSLPTQTHGRQKHCSKLKDKNDRKQKRPVGNTRYKTLGFKWLFKHSATHQVQCNWTGK